MYLTYDCNIMAEAPADDGGIVEAIEGDDDEISEGEDMHDEWINDDESGDDNNMPYMDYWDESNEEDSDNDE
jgi:gamma-glutamyl-gamma-aminobutyrate hydrolase PuuD